MSGRKPRADSKLKSLPGQIQAELREWLVEENVSYATARKWLKERHGVQTSIGAICDFWQSHCFGQRFKRAREVADSLKDALAQSPDLFDESTRGAISQRAFELAVAKDADIGELTKLCKVMGDSSKLAIKQKELDLAERRLEMLEKKAAQADEAEGVAKDKTLTAEEKEARHKEIFGIR